MSTPVSTAIEAAPVPVSESSNSSNPEIKIEQTEEPIKTEEAESNLTPWEFLTTPPDKDTISKPRSENSDTSSLLPTIKPEENQTSDSIDNDRPMESEEAKNFIEALDHLAGSKPEQDSYFYEQNRYGDQLLFSENSLLDVASEETVTPDGSVNKKRKRLHSECGTDIDGSKKWRKRPQQIKTLDGVFFRHGLDTRDRFPRR